MYDNSRQKETSFVRQDSYPSLPPAPQVAHAFSHAPDHLDLSAGASECRKPMVLSSSVWHKVWNTIGQSWSMDVAVSTNVQECTLLLGQLALARNCRVVFDSTLEWWHLPNKNHVSTAFYASWSVCSLWVRHGPPSFEDVKHLYPRDLPCIHGLLCRPAQVFTVGSLCVGVSGKPIPTWHNGAHGLFQFRPKIWLRPLNVVYTLVESHANWQVFLSRGNKAGK